MSLEFRRRNGRFGLSAGAHNILSFIKLSSFRHGWALLGHPAACSDRVRRRASNPSFVPRVDWENWRWKAHKIRVRSGDPNKLRLSMPYHLQKNDINRSLEGFDEYKREKRLP